MLRNPSDKAKTIRVRLQDVFELPPGGAQRYLARSPWKNDANLHAISILAQQAHEFHLAPFEVLTLDLVPQ